MKLHNTLTGEAQEFAPLRPPQVNMYVCGVTPYSSTHIGHAFSYVVFDTLRRYLEFLGYRVKHVQNFTDVDDKIIQRAREQGLSEEALTQLYIDDFFRGMDALNIQRAHLYPRATQEIPRIIELIGTLVKKGYAYHAGDVYYRVTRDPDYGKLSHRTLEGMQAGARVQVDEHKENPMDFVLWKAAKPGEPAWDSPWGPGRPGWHIECSAMSLAYMGETLDLHGGGADLIFPHHENEIAQSEAATGCKPFARWWAHNGLLRLGEDKMSKSLGNLVTVEEILSRYSPDAVRLYFLSAHYRSSLQYSDEGCAAAERSLERLRQAARAAESAAGGVDPLDAAPQRARFLEAMDDDLNTPRAGAALFDLAREINRAREAGRDVAAARQTLQELGGILGLTFREREAAGDNHLAAKPFIELLIDTRAELRKAKQYALADHIRQGLSACGVTLEDSPQGTTWKHEAAR